MDAPTIYSRLITTLMATPCSPVWDGDRFDHLEPLTYEEAHLVAPALLTLFLELNERSAA